LTVRKFTRFARIVLGYNLFVILWGAFVRASGSGAGCGDHWPLCDGALIPATPALTTLIELFHRVTSGVALVLVLLLFIRARKAFAPGHAARRAASASLVLIVIEALIGAAIVLASLFGDNASLARAITVGGHFVNTLILLGALSLTIWFAQHPQPLHFMPLTGTSALMLAGIAGWLVLGASGAVGALSRTLYPSTDLATALSREFSPDAPLLLRLRTLHPLIAAIMGVFMSYLAVRVYREIHTRQTRQLAVSIVAIFFAQCLLGMLNVLMVAPTPALQLSHLLFMDALWIAYVTLCCMALSQARARAGSTSRSPLTATAR
jgi:heme A synthase